MINFFTTFILTKLLRLDLIDDQIKGFLLKVLSVVLANKNIQIETDGFSDKIFWYDFKIFIVLNHFHDAFIFW